MCNCATTIFPYILITGDHWARKILKHRGAQSRPGRYFGPFASAGAVGRTITARSAPFWCALHRLLL